MTLSRSTRKQISMLIAVAAAILVITGCSSTSPNAGTPAKAAASPTSLIGIWTTEGADTGFEANVQTNLIEVFLVDGETKSLFWKGDFKDLVTGPTTIQSKGDLDAMYSSLMGSSEKVKPFEYTGDEITFEFSMMGTSTIVHTTKK